MDGMAERFYKLCFAICSSQTTYQSNKKVNLKLQEVDFFSKDIKLSELETLMKPVRFYKNKAKWLLEMKSKFNFIRRFFIYSIHFSSVHKRDVLIKNFKGLGMKTASMFLRDTGYDYDLAIIDTHILKYLNAAPPKNKKEYLKLEKRFCDIARQKKLRPGQLDAQVWASYSKSFQKGE